MKLRNRLGFGLLSFMEAVKVPEKACERVYGKGKVADGIDYPITTDKPRCILIRVQHVSFRTSGGRILNNDLLSGSEGHCVLVTAPILVVSEIHLRFSKPHTAQSEESICSLSTTPPGKQTDKFLEAERTSLQHAAVL
ncbi:hypothetical protein MCOR17_003773 [Pyricularia oryzae]|nr:hypothetical protein MCOR17_003773 [Pyricularia oryzae]